MKTPIHLAIVGGLLLAVVASAGAQQVSVFGSAASASGQQQQPRQQASSKQANIPSQASDAISQKLHETAQTFLDVWLRGTADGKAQTFIADDALLISPLQDLTPIKGEQFDAAQQHLLRLIQIHDPVCKVMGVDPLRLRVVAECVHGSVQYLPLGKQASNVRAGAMFKFDGDFMIKEFIVTDAEGRINALVKTPADLNLDRLFSTGVRVLIQTVVGTGGQEDHQSGQTNPSSVEQALQPLLQLIDDDIILYFHGFPAFLAPIVGSQTPIQGKREVLGFLQKLNQFGEVLGGGQADATDPHMRRTYSDASTVVALVKMQNMHFSVEYVFNPAGLLAQQHVTFLS